jgi:hypothetical protein
MTLAQLHNPAELFANVAQVILAADSPAFPFPAYANRQLAQQNINRVEITATDAGRASDHMGFATIGNVSTPYYDHGRCSLAFTVISQRASQQVTDNHAYCIGRIGYLLSRPAQDFTPAACSGLVLLDLVQETTAPAEDERTDTDRTTLAFTLDYIIPSAVYAAAT